MNTRTSLSCLLSIVLFAHGGYAQSQPPTPSQSAVAAAEAKSRVHYQKGQEYVAAGKYSEAYAEFEAGYALSKRPLFLFNMAECANQKKDVERARRNYREYLRLEPNGAMANLAQQRMAKLPPPVTPVPAPPQTSTPKQTTPVPLAVRDPAVATTRPKTEQRADLTDSSTPPIWSPRRWPFWAVVGTAAATGVVVAIVTTRDGGDSGIPTVDWSK